MNVRLTREALEDAMRRFDRDLRDSPDWQEWDNNTNHHYAIRWQGRLYPVKHIVHLATGVPVHDLRGRRQRNAMVKNLGLEVVPLDRTPNPDREDAASVRRFLERILPNPYDRRACATALVRSVRAADSRGSAKWGVTLLTDQIRLNVGRVVVAALGKHGIWLALDEPSLSADTRAAFEEELHEGYRSLPNSIGISIPADEASEIYDQVSLAHERLIEQAAQRVRGLFRQVQSAHSPGVLLYLEQELGQSLPRPAYPAHPADPDPPIKPPEGSPSWIFQASPATYDLRGAVRHRPNILWRVPRRSSDVKVGAKVYFWESGPHASLVATARIVTAPEHIPPDDAERPFFVRQEITDRDEPRVRIHIEQRIDPPLPREAVLADATTGSIAVFKGWQGTNLAITSHQAEALDRLIEAHVAVKTSPFAAIRASLQERGLYFSDELLSDYLLALQTKRFVILTGISGTGKTKLAQAIAQHYRPDEPTSGGVDGADAPIEMRASESLLKRGIVRLPKDLLLGRQLPPPDPGKKSAEIDLIYPGGKTRVPVYVEPAGRPIFLFRKEFRAWANATLEEGDPYFLEHVKPAAADGLLTGLRVRLPAADERPGATCIVAVRPDWTDNRGLLGFDNPFSGGYRATPFLELLLEAGHEARRAKREGRVPAPFFAILDEMNLARVEHYFSDFLSCLESGDRLSLDTQVGLEGSAEEGSLDVPRRLPVPSNLFITGTVNVDETTYMFSPKVLDRAFTLEFNEVDLPGYMPTGNAATVPPPADTLRLIDAPSVMRFRGAPDHTDWEAFSRLDQGALRALVEDLHDLLAPHQRHFGYRVANEIARFVTLANEQAGGTKEARWAALDLAILQKVLPKFHGTQQELQEPLIKLFAFAVDPAVTAESDLNQWQPLGGRLQGIAVDGKPPPSPPRLPRTAAKLWRMLKRLGAQGFTSFIE